MVEEILSDEKLLKFIEEEKIKDILSLFSNGRFLELINKYFMIKDYMKIFGITVSFINLSL